MRCNELRRTRRGKLSQTCQSNSPGVQVRRSQSKTQSAFHSAHDETLSVAMGVSNPVLFPDWPIATAPSPKALPLLVCRGGRRYKTGALSNTAF